MRVLVRKDDPRVLLLLVVLVHEDVLKAKQRDPRRLKNPLSVCFKMTPIVEIRVGIVDLEALFVEFSAAPDHLVHLDL